MINKTPTEIEFKVREAKRKNPDASIRSLCRKFKLHHKTINRILGQAKEYLLAPAIKSETFEMTDDTWTITLPKTDIHTLDALLEYCKVDLNVWSVERFICNKWEMGAKDDDNELVIKPLFQIKAFLKKKAVIANAIKEIEALKVKARSDMPLPPRVHKPTSPSQHALELAIVDHHFGKLGWSEETGSESYDIKIAEKIYWEAFYTLKDRVSHYSFEEIVFCVGNDLFQSDNAEGQTTKGTQVSTDGRYQKVFCLVRDTIIKSVEELRKVASKVRVVMVSGNHDALSVWTLGSSLEMYFYHYDDVEIDNSPRMRKYYQYGNNMIMFTHGHTAKLTELPLIMVTEQPKMFGDTKFHEIHTGHKHKKQSDVVLLRDVNENHGIRVRILSALCGSDDYHADNGFVGNQRSSEAFVWDKNDGIIATAVYTYKETGKI